MLTAEQLIKREMIQLAIGNGDFKRDGSVINDDEVDDAFSEFMDSDAYWDCVSEFRSGDVETDIECDYSRHYESKSVAKKLSCGQWVGWTYWYGGGKHGDPDSIDWMSDAYLLNVTEEQKMVTVRTFKKA